MKPLNRKERRVAFLKFLGVFLLTLAIVVFSAFVVGLKIPPSSYSKQEKVCQDRERLAFFIDSLSLHMAVLRELDEKLADQKNEVRRGEQEEQIKHEEQKLRDLIRDLKGLEVEIPEKDALAQIGDSYLLLRTLNRSGGNKFDSTGSGKDCEEWKERLRDANKNIAKLKDLTKDASYSMVNLAERIRVIMLNKGQIRKEIITIKDKLEDTKGIQEIPAY